MNHFNIRVYGILINENKEVLITDEFRFGKEMTKFPGGGLIWGEGTIDCLKREFKEELVCEIEVLEHLYTTDFFQKSAFHEEHQIISIYYWVKNKNLLSLPKKLSLSGEDSGENRDFQSFRWIPVSEISADDFTFPIDKRVAEMLARSAGGLRHQK